jgi:hypothetical protein
MTENKSTRLNLDAKKGNQIELIDGTEVKTVNSNNTKKTLKIGKKLNGSEKQTLNEKGEDNVKIENYNQNDRNDNSSKNRKQKQPSNVNPTDMFADLELIANEETKNRVAELIEQSPAVRDQDREERKNSDSQRQKKERQERERQERERQERERQEQERQEQELQERERQERERQERERKRETSSKVSKASKTSNRISDHHSVGSIPELPPPPTNFPSSERPLDVKRQEREIDAINHRLNNIREENDPDVRSNTSSRIMNFSPAFSLKQKKNQDAYSHAEPTETKRKMTTKELHLEKTKELMKIERLKRRGYQPSRHFSIIDNYEDITAERTRLEETSNLESSIQFQKNGMMFFSSFLEMANNQYNNLFDLNLNGWSDSLHDNIDNFEPVFEELYEKYKDSVQLAPEIKLVVMFFGSAVSYHFSQQLLKKAESSIPGFREVMGNNPGLKKAYTDTAAQMFARNMAGSSGSGSGGGGGGGGPDLGGVLGMFSGILGGGDEPKGPTVTRSKPTANNVQLKEPAGFDDLLKDVGLSRLTETSLNIGDDLTSYVSNNQLKNVHMSSSKRSVKKGGAT